MATPPTSRGSRGELLISACLIVRDEEADLPRCLAALRGVVDEVVVHDTGSTDRTIEIARRHGATVIEGSWEDDFGAARNVALAACRGEWILHVDADEELLAEPSALRGALGSQELAGADALLVTVENLDDAGAVDVRHKSCRIFRRSAGRWQGRIHEQVVSTTDAPLRPAVLDGIAIRHHGYTTAHRSGRGKPARNLDLATTALREAEAADAARAHLDLARSLAAAGRHEEALEHCQTARALPASDAARAWIHRFGAEVCLTLGQPEAARAWVADLRALGLGSRVADLLDGTALLMLGRGDEALELFDGIGDAWDRTGITVPEHLIRQRRGLALAATGDHVGAAAELLAVVRERPAAPVWGQLAVSALHSSGATTVQAITAAVPEEHLRAVVLQLLLAPTDAAEAVGQVLWAERGADPRLLGFAVHHAARLDTARALEWSARLRAFGLESHCPLVARAEDAAVDSVERVLAAAVAHGTFDDDRARQALCAAAPGVATDQLTDVLSLLDQLSPSLLAPFVLAAACDPSRAAAVADSLDALGAVEQAQLLRSV